MQPGDAAVVESRELDTLLGLLRERGYETVGPVLRDGAVVYGELHTAADLPRGWTDEQDGGRYRLRCRNDQALFGYAVGPDSLKRFLEPPSEVCWRGRRVDGGVEDEPIFEPPTRRAFVGLRPCDLAALGVKDRLYLGLTGVDPAYRTRREAVFLVAVNCTSPGGTCFCASMGTGPRAGSGFDLALTEILDTSRHDLVVEVGTERGGAVAESLAHRRAEPDDLAAIGMALEAAVKRMGRVLPTEGLKERLDGTSSSHEDPHWDRVGERCLTCGSCTMVCPTCFCATIEDAGTLDGTHAERRRVWDSCFSVEFSYVHGGSVRTSAGARYRQWMMHKLATWYDQFGTSGCVGCGRCITWCPAGIDITAEAAAVLRGHGQGGRP